MTTYKRETPRATVERRHHISGRAVRGTIVDAYYLDGRLYASSCPACAQPAAPGLIYCHPCQARVERLHALALSARCLSCGDPCGAVVCAACRETGEPVGAFGTEYTEVME